jgi:polyribonucleotide nucleotidyltransferase
VKAAVAGVAMGLIKEGEGKFHVLTDIMGDEDHCGDMDFKIAGTKDGVTAVQMDIKISGVDKEIMRKALAQAREARLDILESMNRAISEPRPELSPHAPRIMTIKIPVDKIKDVIGPGGKMIRSIVEETGAIIDVEDDGTVKIASADAEANEKALQIINDLTEEAEVDKVYTGKVVRITDFGAFVEIMPGTDGLLHISEIENRRIEKVTDVLREGDEVVVKCIRIDPDGKVGLSRREVLDQQPEGSRKPRGGGRGDDDPRAPAGSRPYSGKPRPGGRDDKSGGRDRPRGRGKPRDRFKKDKD